LEKNIAGQYNPVKECFQCPNATYPGGTNSVYECRQCPEGKIYDKNFNPWKCSCNLTSFLEAGDKCIPISDSQKIISDYPINIAKSIQYTNVETIDKTVDGISSVASSDTFDYLYLKSGYDCLKRTNMLSCQTLANLCVLQMYDQTNPVCKLYNYINDLRPALATNSE